MVTMPSCLKTFCNILCFLSTDQFPVKTIVHVLEWLDAMCSHVPNKGEQMVRYYGYYRNGARGKRKKADADDKIPCILEPELTDKAFR